MCKAGLCKCYSTWPTNILKTPTKINQIWLTLWDTYEHMGYICDELKPFLNTNL